MLQTISYVMYLALGAGVFSAVESWNYLDGLYWSNYTLLTIGLGSDFSPSTTLGRALLIPYAAVGITMIGLIVGSIRGLVLERGKAKVGRRSLGKQRDKKMEAMDQPSAEWKRREFEAMRKIEERAERIQRYSGLGVSLFAYAVVWLGGALVFWFTEKV
jgi:potassium channel subfamily K, other eukaryote